MIGSTGSNTSLAVNTSNSQINANSSSSKEKLQPESGGVKNVVQDFTVSTKKINIRPRPVRLLLFFRTTCFILDLHFIKRTT